MPTLPSDTQIQQAISILEANGKFAYLRQSGIGHPELKSYALALEQNRLALQEAYENLARAQVADEENNVYRGLAEIMQHIYSELRDIQFHDKSDEASVIARLDRVNDQVLAAISISTDLQLTKGDYDEALDAALTSITKLIQTAPTYELPEDP